MSEHSERRSGDDRRETPRDSADRRTRELLARVREHPWNDGTTARPTHEHLCKIGASK